MRPTLLRPTLLRHAFPALAALFASTVALSAAGAQLSGTPRSPGNGLGGPGGAGGANVRREAQRSSAAKRLEDMGSLKDVLKHVDGLTSAQKDSLKHVESHYTENFKHYGSALKRLLTDAGDHGTPNPDEMRKLEDGARSLREDELKTARAVLATDPQRTQFDANAAALQDDDAKQGRRPS